jgi:hypothetical protein
MLSTLEALCKALGVKRVFAVDAFDLKELERRVKSELEADETSVIITRRPCIFLLSSFDEPLFVDQELCTGCKTCVGLGCPAISFKDEKALSTKLSVTPAVFANSSAALTLLSTLRERQVQLMNKTDILIAGVGGQGTILTGRVIAALAMAEGLDVKTAETHGMAQRGGSVITHVRIDEKVYSPLIPQGDGDILLSFEKMEALRWLPYLSLPGER